MSDLGRLRIALGYPLVVLLLIATVHQVASFNLDTTNYINFNGNPDSMFGFSLALHQESKISYVIVGAPTEDTSQVQRDVHRGGAVFKCDVRENDKCIMIPFDRNGNNLNDKGDQVDTKSNQWFGATVASGGIDGPVVACAPRYVYHTTTPKKVERVDPVGTCYVAKNNFREFVEYSPCRTMYWGYHRQGSCQAGMSAAISKDGDRMLIGAPGSWYWQGQAYSIHTASHFPFKPPRYSQFGEGGQVYSTPTRSDAKVFQSQEGTASEDDSYLGYSSATGDVAHGQPGVAVGMPRGGKLEGKVLVYTWNLTNIQNITGEQIGAYFGYSLCINDVDGDGRQDLIIGAPMYTEANNEGKYEVGRVYIMFQTANGFEEFDTRDGLASKGRFGLALTSLGDINLDGFGDVAIGAPYDGPKGHGAVYIFHGSKNGLLPKASQVIYAEDVSGSRPISTFGFSLSGGIDLDGNLYPDLAVGAYESNSAYVLKSRPVAVVEASSVFESENKLISLDHAECTLPQSGKKVACTTVMSCLKYHGINLPQTIDLEISWVLDSKKSRQPRMFFVREEARNVRNQTIRLTRGKMECLRETVFIAEAIRDKLTPLEVEMKYDMRQQYPSATPHIRRPRSILEPILDHNLGLVQRDSINIQKNCGPDNECIPDLRLEVKAVDKYLLGSKDLLVVEVIVMNHGEDAFESNFFMTIPPGLDYKRVDKKGELRDTAITCTAPNRDNNNVLKCELGNPFPGGKVAKFNVVLNPAQKAGMAPSYEFYMEANSTNAEREGSGLDNVYKKTIGIWLETDLNIKGNSYPQEFHYNLTQYKEIENATTEQEIGPQVVHIYDISNFGPSTIEEAEIYVIWPYETLEGDELMYLMARPETSGNIRCDDSVLINRRRLKIDQIVDKKGVLEEFTGVVSKSSSQGFAKKQEDGQVSKVAIDKSSSSSSGSRGSSSSSSGSRFHNEKRLTEEEVRRLDAEDNLESTGDASLVHRHRQQGGASGNYQQSASWSSQSGSQGGSPVTITKVQNRTTYSGADGKTRTFESSTEYSNIHAASIGGVSGGSSSSGSYRQQQGSMNRPGTYKIPDIQTEEVINQDLSSLAASRASSGGRFTNMNTIETTTKATGRRRMMTQEDGGSVRAGGYASAPTQMEKMAQGGHGFQASTMDLGVAGRTSGGSGGAVSGGSSHGSSHSSSSSTGGRTSGQTTNFQSGGSSGGYSGGKFQYGSNPSQHYSSSSIGQSSTQGSNAGRTGSAGHHLSTANYNDNEADDDYSLDDYDYEAQDNANSNTHSGGHRQSHQSSSSHGGSHSQHQQFSGHDDKLQHYRRFRRDADNDDVDEDDHELMKELSACNATKCAILKCYAGPLVHDDRAFIGLRTRLVAYTLDKNTLNVPLNISSKVVARIVKLPYIGEPQEKPLKTFEVPVKAIPEPIVTPDVVPLWVVILSAVAGALILLLLIYLLYKCGFFKRNRPTDHSQERQPLNRNGNYHGDEHL